MPVSEIPGKVGELNEDCRVATLNNHKVSRPHPREGKEGNKCGLFPSVCINTFVFVSHALNATLYISFIAVSLVHGCINSFCSVPYNYDYVHLCILTDRL